ncbi:hypothetical protein NDU88_006084 [Pleurodeles waltl]|uniref:Uncharacterized protein n=1 Tax=Pleurodeles waltl TaxID=8319 RepID=A0AAV7WDN6_PLEWA|nr:hypothetical protein NDU88_006084 [Pleurodeles waltl]
MSFSLHPTSLVPGVGLKETLPCLGSTDPTNVILEVGCGKPILAKDKRVWYVKAVIHEKICGFIEIFVRFMRPFDTVLCGSLDVSPQIQTPTCCTSLSHHGILVPVPCSLVRYFIFGKSVREPCWVRNHGARLLTNKRTRITASRNLRRACCRTSHLRRIATTRQQQKDMS